MNGKEKSKVKRTSVTFSIIIILSLLIFGSILCFFIFDFKTPYINNHSLRSMNFELPNFNNNIYELDILINKSAHEKRLYSKKDTITSYPPLPTSENDYKISYPSSLLDIIKAWNPDNADSPKSFREQLFHFNYSNPEERKIAEIFRNKELPFKVYDIPEFEYAILKWDDAYLTKQLEKESSHVEESTTNHFMFWKSNGKSMKNWKQPTKYVSMNFPTWLNYAREADRTKLTAANRHYYFMSNAALRDHSRTYIARDLPVFSTKTDNFFVSNVKANKGIQCRFGMRGIIAEAHYDSGRNMVAMLKGKKRYIISPPSTCKQLGIISDVKHPSYRHSIIDWSDEAQAESRGFDKVNAIDTIVHTGEVLYIPSYWLHYIISLEYSIQCNSRSGSPPNGEGQDEIEKCLGNKLVIK